MSEGRSNRGQYLLFLAFLYFFLLYDWLGQNVDFIRYADELIAACAIPLFLYQKKRCPRREHTSYNICVAGFLDLGLLSSILSQNQPFFRAVLPDMFLCVKFWLALYVGQYFLKDFSLRDYAQRIFFHIRWITVFYTFLIVINDALLFAGCESWFPASIRYGLYSTQLFYSHPTIFAACCALLIAVLAGIREYVKGTDRFFVWLVLLLCTTLKSKAFGAAFVYGAIYYLAYIRRKKVGLKTVLFCAAVLILLGWRQIDYYFFSSIQATSARYQLTAKSLQIARDYFPLGGGFAAFGSYFSGVYYSPLYEAYGISQVWGLRPGSHDFISDTFWPMILGQTGVFGLVLFVLALFFLFKRIQGLRKVHTPFYVSALGMFLYLLISSTAESAFVHPTAIPLALWMGALFSFAEDGRAGGQTYIAADPEAGSAQERPQAYTVWKRVQDVSLSLLALLVLWPFILAAAVVIVIESPGASPFFIQERVGKNGKTFRMIKLRTMVPGAERQIDQLLERNEMDAPVFKIKNDPRITKFGTFLRKTGFDELPQLWNVLCGHMSLVGPRPPLAREVEQYGAREMQRLSVRPGLTCYWQIQPGRNQMSFEKWMELDLQYIRERSFFVDWKIIFQTVGAIIHMQGE